ncbi:riboflavin biosynthesis protein PYRD, chloroplastic [Macadamia integrifolia]|uniref:riboflavin biosynthesis protein PYRD, chloroplastic n=1 Tax=Macadamia integrifolia TaxID=60698 RepID=UPI001C4E92E9|nr:riboflavin biosynthesis protein PYRD, chloroplastic [Macadamia integrifolia]XP_042500104.1 riboflavin biosynthesis protein PYRD, chloroplastic [Macadamia integrifolia]
MQLQTLTPPTYYRNAPSFPLCSCRSICFQPVGPYVKCLSSSNSNNGFCSLRRRVAKSLTSWRKQDGLVIIRCEGFREKDDSFYMRRCVELARKAIGCTSPNPMVGCVIVRDGQIVGEGFHPKAGQPHAEVFALRDAGELAENATAYVSLEPCNHYGRTPPCTEALIQAKVKEVVVGMVDPNPIVASKGVERLRDSGIYVRMGVEEELCKSLNEAFIHRMLTGKPLTTLRYSVSVNGCILNQVGHGATEAGGYYSELLQEYDAVMLSSASSSKCFPASEEPGASQPLKLIIATHPESLLQLPVLTTGTTSRVIVFTTERTVAGLEMGGQGIEIVAFDQINLNIILDYCSKRGLCSVLMDLQGNGTDFQELLGEGLEQGLLQKVVMEVVPLWDQGGGSSFPAFKDLEKRPIALRNLKSRTVRETVLVDGYFC